MTFGCKCIAEIGQSIDSRIIRAHGSPAPLWRSQVNEAIIRGLNLNDQPPPPPPPPHNGNPGSAHESARTRIWPVYACSREIGLYTVRCVRGGSSRAGRERAAVAGTTRGERGKGRLRDARHREITSRVSHPREGVAAAAAATAGRSGERRLLLPLLYYCAAVSSSSILGSIAKRERERGGCARNGLCPLYGGRRARPAGICLVSLFMRFNIVIWHHQGVSLAPSLFLFLFPPALPPSLPFLLFRLLSAALSFKLGEQAEREREGEREERSRSFAIRARPTPDSADTYFGEVCHFKRTYPGD